MALFRNLGTAVLALALLAGATARAQIAQKPLLTKPAAADPNVVLMFDDSTSMKDNFLYTDATGSMWGASGYNMFNQHGVQPPFGDDFAKCSPQVNRIYYDPTKRYLPRKNYDGSLQSPGSVAAALAGAPCTATSGATPYPASYVYLGQPRRYDLRASYQTVTAVISPASTYVRSSARTDCAGSICTYEEEIQNYANWYAYYRTRMEAARTALSHAFANLPGEFRLGWSRINTLASIYNQTLGTLDAGVSSYDSDTRQRLYEWLEGILIGDANFTPSRKALNVVGTYFSRADSDGPWGTRPNPASRSAATPTTIKSTEPPASHAACRRSHAILITDGYYNDYQQSPFSFPDVDDQTGTPISGPGGRTFRYSPEPPFRSSYGNTLADVAMKFWSSDLRDLPNLVPPVLGQDPAFWQHLNFHGITFGVQGTLPQTATTLAQLTAGDRNWPAPPTQNAPEAIDDLWHATINARGALLNANDSEELTAALQYLIEDILRTSSSQAGVAASSVNLVSGTLKFVPKFTSGTWNGNLVAARLDPTTGSETSMAWQVETIDASTGREITNTLGAPSGRNIWVGNAPTATPKALSFTYAAMVPAGLVASMGSGASAALIDFLRGDRSQEGTAFRRRDAVLGDIVNSAPTFVRPAIDYGHAKLPGAAGSSYKAYLDAKATLTEGAVFVGANDGMFHAFAERDGRELFAYVPNAVVPALPQLGSRYYNHRYFVDGPVTQGDYYAGGAWRTAVVATAGAGAKTVFAVDATRPTLLTGASVLWEVNSATSGFDDLGHVLSEARIGLMRNGRWAAVFANGYGSASGVGALFVVDLTDGRLIRKIPVPSSGVNGLGGVRLVLNAANEVIGAYAGDLQGKLWKFDLSSSSETNWQVAFDGVPLYAATDSGGTVQAITAAPFVVSHPQGGWLVTFATGKLFETGDPAVATQQAAYGVWDKVAFGAQTYPAGSTLSGTSSLVVRAITTTATVSQVVTAPGGSGTSTQVVSYYDVAGAAVDWSTKRGWYLPLPVAGQRTVYPVDSFYGRLARIETVIPATVIGDPCAPNPARGANYVIDPLTGSSPIGGVFGVDGSTGRAAGGYSTTADGRDVVLIGARSGNQITVKSCNSGPECTGGPLDLCANGLEVCARITRRSWRQLFMR